MCLLLFVSLCRVVFIIGSTAISYYDRYTYVMTQMTRKWRYIFAVLFIFQVMWVNCAAQKHERSLRSGIVNSGVVGCTFKPTHSSLVL